MSDPVTNSSRTRSIAATVNPHRTATGSYTGLRSPSQLLQQARTGEQSVTNRKSTKETPLKKQNKSKPTSVLFTSYSHPPTVLAIALKRERSIDTGKFSRKKKEGANGKNFEATRLNTESPQKKRPKKNTEANSRDLHS